MPAKKENDNRPYWVWSVPRTVLNLQVKHFYAYFCVFGEHANYQWNCRLAKYFHVSRSTIKAWLRVLKRYHLVWITSGGGPHRRIHTRHYKSQIDWLTTIAIPKTTKTFTNETVKRSKKELEERRQALIKQCKFLSSLTGQKTDHYIL
jgi:hypothetical protein